MIKSIDEKAGLPLEIDLTGPGGNAFALIAVARKLGNQINKNRGGEYIDVKSMIVDMMSGDYEHLLEVMEKYLGEHITMYR